MDAYTSFAEVYDMFMDNIPYEDWCGYLTSLLKEYGINDGLVLDLVLILVISSLFSLFILSYLLLPFSDGNFLFTLYT